MVVIKSRSSFISALIVYKKMADMDVVAAEGRRNEFGEKTNEKEHRRQKITNEEVNHIRLSRKKKKDFLLFNINPNFEAQKKKVLWS